MAFTLLLLKKDEIFPRVAQTHQTLLPRYLENTSTLNK